MSDKPSILEGGSSRNFSPVDSLSINKQSDGLSTWVLADSVEVGSLDASQNGLYLAIEDDYFAYDQIVVNVSDDLADADDATKATGKIVGKDPDIDPNNDYAVGLDEDGNLTKEMIPAAIHIVVPPRKLKYEEGETLDFTGIHVYLMDGNNKRYTDSSYPTGEIPFGELIFPVTIASNEGTELYPENYDQYKNNTTFINAMNELDKYKELLPITVYSDRGYGLLEYNRISNYEIREDGSLLIKGASKSVANALPNNYVVWRLYETKGDADGGKSGQYSIDGWNWENNKLSYKNTITIPVQWMRSDGEILEDTFTITVVPEGEDAGEEEQTQDDPFVGYADVSWGGHHYNLNRRLVPPVQYSNGYCWRQQASEYVAEYTVEQAASMGWLILIR